MHSTLCKEAAPQGVASKLEPTPELLLEAASKDEQGEVPMGASRSMELPRDNPLDSRSPLMVDAGKATELESASTAFGRLKESRHPPRPRLKGRSVSLHMGA